MSVSVSVWGAQARNWFDGQHVCRPELTYGSSPASQAVQLLTVSCSWSRLA